VSVYRGEIALALHFADERRDAVAQLDRMVSRTRTQRSCRNLFVALLGAWRYRRYLFWVFLPLFIAMCVSTIYCRYHYIADVFAGILVGAIGFILAERLMAVRGANPADRVSLQN